VYVSYPHRQGVRVLPAPAGCTYPTPTGKVYGSPAVLVGCYMERAGKTTWTKLLLVSTD